MVNKLLHLFRGHWQFLVTFWKVIYSDAYSFNKNRFFEHCQFLPDFTLLHWGPFWIKKVQRFCLFLVSNVQYSKWDTVQKWQIFGAPFWFKMASFDYMHQIIGFEWLTNNFEVWLLNAILLWRQFLKKNSIWIRIVKH